MDLSSANTEAFIQLHRFHEHLNRTIKTLVIGLGLASEAVQENRPQESIRQLLYDRDWLWGGMPDWNEPDALIDEARRDIGQTGVVRAFSAFDFFLDSIEADLASWAHRLLSTDQRGLPKRAKESPPPIEDETESADRLVGFYDRLGVGRDGIEFIWPVYRYFRLARDCIVHRRGVASRASAELSNSSQISEAIKGWATYTGEMNNIELLSLEEGQEIAFTHRQALLASSVIRLIALDINRICLAKLGAAGVVFLTARRLFIDRPPSLKVLSFRSVENAMHGILGDRYRITGLIAAETRQIMRELDIWPLCNKRLKDLKRIQITNPTTDLLAP